ncbi:MAG TPA: SDR family NAD(P)-dependent oxidoreductase [Gammaproteobacteria bacterium]|nr:SDR family NAD(P)-dependent oxidoreductase [Gammaproteobacteria bacterium]
MRLDGNKVLITGGGTGIGYEFSRMFLAAGSKVLVCGRRQPPLEELRHKYPQQVECLVADVSAESERDRLVEWVKTAHPDVNVLVNNAGVQERVEISEKDFWKRTSREIDLNLKGPIHLCSALLPVIEKNQNPIIINVTSGLAFTPIARMPVYCATKAALRSFTLSLRHLLKDKVEVIEVIPPAVDTDLGGAGLHTQGVPLAEFGKAVEEQLRGGNLEITHSFSAAMLKAGPEELKKAFQRMNP